MLEEQLWAPLLAADEMGNASRAAVVERIAQLTDYAGLFEQAFAHEGPSEQSIARALAAYQRSLTAGGSRFDRWRFAGDAGALSALEQAGFVLFTGKARCAACHTIDAAHALFSDQRFHNTGVGWVKAHRPASEVSVPLAPGVETQLDTALLNRLFGGDPRDEGRFEVTAREADRFAYRTPILRNVALTAPYMHDGSLATLEAVVEFYDRGGIDNPGKDRLLAPLDLTTAEKKALVAFLRALTGTSVERLAAEARRSASTPSIDTPMENLGGRVIPPLPIPTAEGEGTPSAP
jgi:cytochrome c peroxidase